MFDLLAAPGQKAASGSEQPAQQAAGEDQPGSEGKGWLLFCQQQIFFSASCCSFPIFALSVLACTDSNYMQFTFSSPQYVQKMVLLTRVEIKFALLLFLSFFLHAYIYIQYPALKRITIKKTKIKSPNVFNWNKVSVKMCVGKQRV